MSHRTKVFVSYCHRDKPWLKRLQVHLKPLEREGLIAVWDDTRIKPGSKWQEEITDALRSAKVAVLLISADFLASDFIVHNELPPLLSAAKNDGAIILPVIVGACRFSRTPVLAQFQTVNSPERPLDQLSKGEQEAILDRVGSVIEDILRDPVLKPSKQDNSVTAELTPMVDAGPIANDAKKSSFQYKKSVTPSPSILGLSPDPPGGASLPATSNIAIYGNISAGVSNVGGNLDIKGPVSVELSPQNLTSNLSANRNHGLDQSIRSLVAKSQLADSVNKSGLQHAVKQLAAQLEAFQASLPKPLEALVHALHALLDELTTTPLDFEMAGYLCDAARHASKPFKAHCEEIPGLTAEITLQVKILTGDG